MQYLTMGISNIICCNVYHTYSVILNIGHLEQYGVQMQMEKIRDFVLAQEQYGSLMQVNFVLLLDIV